MTASKLNQANKLSTQDWKDIEEKLKSFYSPVTLMCDNFEITLVLERISIYRNAIAVYVNGEIRGKWFLEDCEERRRFYRASERSLLSKKERDNFKKLLRTKKEKKEYEERMKFTTYSSHWTSFRSLKKHLIDNNEVIELVGEANKSEVKS